jgi:hypothetical protein
MLDVSIQTDPLAVSLGLASLLLALREQHQTSPFFKKLLAGHVSRTQDLEEHLIPGLLD